MGEKIIAVNWKWRGEITTHEEYQVSHCNNCKVYFTNFNNTGVGNGLSDYKKFIINIFKQSEDQVLVLTHTSEPNQISKTDLTEIKCEQHKLIENFGGGEDKIYYSKGGFLFSSADFNLFKETLEGISGNPKEIPKDRFDNVWNWYWSQSVLEFQKKKLINTFLPLAIDMKGLSQMSNNEKRKQYQEEIIQDIKLNGDKIIKEWKEIKNNLAIESDKDVLSEKYQLNPKQKNNIKFPLERGNSSFSKKELIKLFEKGSWPEGEDEFLPKWLEEAIEILDRKIEEKNNQ